jgi:predicted NAD-dependent protein-ADP-ribosyltransferase YbiA (DUF1768 family)
MSSFKGKEVVCFESNAVRPYNLLTNFSLLPRGLTLTRDNCDPALFVACPELKEWLSAPGATFTFATSEAAWQALKARNRKTFERFLRTGDLGMLSIGFYAMIYPNDPDEALRKFKEWSKKENHGIAPKLASNPMYSKCLGLKSGIDMAYERENLDAATEKAVWLSILSIKFAQNPEHKAVLMSTGSAYLLERRNRATAAEHWGGKLVGPDLTLVGENVMGIYMAAAREALRG